MRRRDFLVGSTAAALFAAESKTEPLDIRTGRGVATKLYYGEAWPKPFLYPIRTVSGRVLSRGFPLEPQDGDSTDHLWHRGIWYGHGIINGADFWREQGADKSGRLVVKSKPKVGRASVSLDLSLTPPTGSAFGTIRQKFHIEDHDKLRMIDAAIVISADAGQALVFGDSDDGGYAFRLTEAFREDRGAQLRNSEGQSGTKNIWGKPARWVDYSADVGGGPTGVAILDHPKNLRHPSRWHARGYGLCAANPFALKSFTRDSSVDGGYTLPAGQKLVFRYRTIIRDGPFDATEMERLYSQFATT